MKKYCTKCGHEFEAVGREVICPSCKAQAAEETKRAAVERAKLASWTGESVPVRISGRASTLIRRYGAAHGLPFAQALDALLQASDYFASLDTAWEDVEPYKTRRRDKHTTDAPQASKPQGKAQDASQTAQDAPQTAQDVPHDVKQAGKAQDAPQAAQAAKASKPQDVQTAQDVTSKPQAAKVASNASASKASANKTATSKTSKTSKASKTSKTSK